MNWLYHTKLVRYYFKFSWSRQYFVLETFSFFFLSERLESIFKLEKLLPKKDFLLTKMSYGSRCVQATCENNAGKWNAFSNCKKTFLGKLFHNHKSFNLWAKSIMSKLSFWRVRVLENKSKEWIVPSFLWLFLIFPDCDFPENFCTYPNIQQMIHDQHFTLELNQPQRFCDDLWRLTSQLEEYWQSLVSIKVGFISKEK